MAELGKAYIEVRADLAKFPAELRTKLAAALKTGLSGVEFTGLGDAAERAGEDAAKRAGQGFSRQAKTTLSRSGQDAGRGLLGGLTDVFTRERSRGESGGLFSSISGLFGDAIKGGLGKLSAVGGAVSSLGSVATGLSSLGGIAAAVAQLAALAVLAPIIIGVAGAVVQLGAALFALPAGAGIAVAALAPLAIALQGVGEAISAGISGDLEAYDAALKKLAPSARTVTKEIVALGPALKAIKTSVQQAFFAPLIGSFAPLAKTLLPVLNQGLALTAGALGRVAAGFVGLVGANDIVEVIGDVFESAGRVIDRLGPSITNLFGVLFGVTEKGLPTAERFFGAIADGIDSVTAWLSEIQQDGSLERWLGKAYDIGEDLFRILKALGIYVVQFLGGDIGDEGGSFLDSLADGLERLNAFMATEEGQEYLANVAQLVKLAAGAFLFFASSVDDTIKAVNAVFKFFRQIGPTIEAVGAIAGDALGDVGAFFSGIGRDIGRFFTETIPQAAAAVGDFFASLPGKAVEGAASFRDTLIELGKNAVTGLIDEFFKGVGRFIGLMIVLPGLIGTALVNLPPTIMSLVGQGWDAAYEYTATKVSQIIEYLAGVPARVFAFAASLRESIAGAWRDGWNDATSFVSSGIERVVAFIGSIPGRIRSLGPALLAAARSLGESIGRGLSNVGDFASDIGRKIVNTVRSGINSVIRSINSGIGEIDAVIPGSLPRIPQLARGAIVDSPTLAVIGEAGREVVLPLDKPGRAQELAEQAGLFDILRAPGGGMPTINLTAILDGFGVMRVVRMVVDESLTEQGEELGFGART